jgi:hypothetical protein
MTNVHAVATALSHMQISQREGEQFIRERGADVENVLSIVQRCPGCGFWAYTDSMLAGYCRSCMEEKYDKS